MNMAMTLMDDETAWLAADAAGPDLDADAAGLDAEAARRALELTGVLALIVDDQQRIVMMNPALRAAIQTCGDVLDVGDDAARCVASKLAPDFRRSVRDAAHGSASVAEYALRAPDGVNARSIAWTFGRIETNPCRVACIGVDVTATRNEVEDLRLRAVTDELTGLANRAGLLEYLSTASATGATVIFCDLDGFKRVNDTLGHAAGDAVLVQTARRLVRTVRGEDFVARLGGDEFVIVVPQDAHTSFEGLGRRLLRAIEQPMILPGGVAATVGMSIGEAQLSPGADPAVVLHAADGNMYKMKSRLPTRMSGDA